MIHSHAHKHNTHTHHLLAAVAKTHLTLAAEPPEQLVALELGLLVGHDARHLEDEARLRLLVHAQLVRIDHRRHGGRVVHHHRIHVHHDGRPVCLIGSGG